MTGYSATKQRVYPIDKGRTSKWLPKSSIPVFALRHGFFLLACPPGFPLALKKRKGRKSSPHVHVVNYLHGRTFSFHPLL
jgi:hypothetical protein